jgi:hypothetical protein
MQSKTLVLPLSPARAFELLVLLIERDGDAMEQCGDDSWSVVSTPATPFFRRGADGSMLWAAAIGRKPRA